MVSPPRSANSLQPRTAVATAHHQPKCEIVLAQEDRKDPEADEALAKIRKRLSKTLADFSSDFPAGLDRWNMESSRPPAELFPVPELVLFAFRNILGWRWSGVAEKVRWTVYGSVLGEPVRFELRKFGFTILRAKDHKVLYDRIVGQVGAAMRQIEDLLAPFAVEQARSGNVLIINRFGEFEGRYRYFLGKARKASAKADKPAQLPGAMAKGADAVERWIEHWRHNWTTHANMDY